MKKYNDLRDYHERKFIKENFIKLTFININIFGLYTTFKISSYLPNSISKTSAVISQTTIYIAGIIDTLHTGLKKIEKNIQEIDLKEILIVRNKIYSQIISNVVTYIKNNNINNPVDIIHLLHDMIMNGELSYKKKFITINLVEEDYNYSYQIINGNGVCRSFAQITTDIFRSLGYDAYEIFCTDLNNKMCHLITMVKYKNKTYYLDTYNNVEYTYESDCFKYFEKEGYIPINIHNAHFSEIEIKSLSFLMNYYMKKRNKNDCIKCVLTPLEKSKQEDKNDKQFDSSAIYESNKKLYKKFKKTYL